MNDNSLLVSAASLRYFNEMYGERSKNAKPIIEHFDVMIVGAGLSGTGAAYNIQTRCPGRSYVILEGRADLGGTWDLFRYPGVRSDSDMHTLGYNFKPWLADKAIADGPSILDYVRETAIENGIIKNIRYQHQVKRADWSSEDACWTIDVSRGEQGDIARFTCNFLFMCAGYYSYKGGYNPSFSGRDDFEGMVIHPQAWPEIRVSTRWGCRRTVRATGLRCAPL